MTKIAATFLLAAVAAVPVAGAQTRASRTAKRPQPVPKAVPRAVEAPEPVDVREVFAVATSAERWSLEDPQPKESVDFGGKRVSFGDRLVNTARNPSGEEQLLFPVSWYTPYQEQGSDLKYVVVRYRNGKACEIIAEYLPKRVALPMDQFTRHPDGKSFYSDISVVRQDGRVYMKQAISQGAQDGKGGLWIDTVVIYSAADKARASNP